MAPEINLIDPSGYERRGAPHDQFRWLRENAPVYWHPDPNDSVPGFWAVTRYEDVVHISRHPELFSSQRRTSMFDEYSDEDIALQQQMMLFMDPPAHTRKRGLVNRGFTPRMIKQLEAHIREICDELLDDVAGHGEADFVKDIAAPLPLYVICELMGAPVADRDKIFDLSNRLIGFDDPELANSMDAAKEASAEIYLYANELAARRRQDPRDDIASRLLQPDDQGDVLTEDEFDLFILLLTVAGNETTRNAASGGMQAFFDHPAQWQRLRDNRGALRTTADEIVRWVSPVNLFRRTATRDTEIGGQRIKENDKVVVFYAAANRDESVFDNSDVFDIGRDPNPHIGFGGGGPHFCLGTHLARLELTVLFETLLDRMPDIKPAGEARRLRSNFINGVKEMPVQFTPLAR